jgi:hypothetical protein
VALAGCDAVPARTAPLFAQDTISRGEFAGLVERLSEPGGYFDTDNLISNETGYLKVIGALGALDVQGGAYVGVGPDQNFSYIAEVRPAVAFVVDVRRDNLLQHLLLKALIERAPTRLEFLAGLHGRPLPTGEWEDWGLDEIVGYLDAVAPSADVGASLSEEISGALASYGIPLSDEDHQTIDRFHRAFVDAGLGLRFTSFGRAPRPYYPTYRQLVLETDIEGDPASYLANESRYAVVRELHLANRIIPVVGDLSGSEALQEIGGVMAEMGEELTAFYASNVEYYLWNAGTFERWLANLAELPRAPGAVLIRSYFPNFARPHPSAVAGYYSTQLLQPIEVLISGGFSSYWDVVTRGVLPLR